MNTSRSLLAELTQLSLWAVKLMLITAHIINSDNVVCVQFKVNGREFFSMPHRIPVERVSAMNISGDVSIQTINIIGVRIRLKWPVINMGLYVIAG